MRKMTDPISASLQNLVKVGHTLSRQLGQKVVIIRTGIARSKRVGHGRRIGLTRMNTDAHIDMCHGKELVRDYLAEVCASIGLSVTITCSTRKLASIDHFRRTSANACAFMILPRPDQ